MSNNEVLEQALKLGPHERFLVVEELLRSLDRPDAEIDEIWAEEAERRLQAHREGRLKTFSLEEVFGSGK